MKVLWRSGNAAVCLASPDLAKRDKRNMSYFTYVLKSQKNGDFYGGSAENVSIRLARHNNGEVRSTKGYRPWQLLESHSFETRSEAVQYERFLKNHQQKEILKNKYGAVVK